MRMAATLFVRHPFRFPSPPHYQAVWSPFESSLKPFYSKEQ